MLQLAGMESKQRLLHRFLEGYFVFWQIRSTDSCNWNIQGIGELL
jgi:hypothetical protein